jgi:hypothetical protein
VEFIAAPNAPKLSERRFQQSPTVLIIQGVLSKDWKNSALFAISVGGSLAHILLTGKNHALTPLDMQPSA